MRRGDFVRISVLDRYGDNWCSTWEYQPVTEGSTNMPTDTIDVTKLSFLKGFVPKDITLVFDKGRSIICAFVNNYKGRDDFNIRELYQEYGEWCPGKGISVPMDKRDELLKGLTRLAEKYIASP